MAAVCLGPIICAWVMHKKHPCFQSGRRMSFYVMLTAGEVIGISHRSVHLSVMAKHILSSPAVMGRVWASSEFCEFNWRLLSAKHQREWHSCRIFCAGKQLHHLFNYWDLWQFSVRKTQNRRVWAEDRDEQQGQGRMGVPRHRHLWLWLSLSLLGPEVGPSM